MPLLYPIYYIPKAASSIDSGKSPRARSYQTGERKWAPKKFLGESGQHNCLIVDWIQSYITINMTG